MTVVEVPSGTQVTPEWLTQVTPERLGGRFRLDERISVGDRISGACGASAEAGGLSLWKATDELLGRPVTIYLLPAGQPVPDRVVQAARSAAKVCDSRLATIYDTDFSADCPYIVAEWAPGTHLEDLVLSGLPSPALAAAMRRLLDDEAVTPQQGGHLAVGVLVLVVGVDEGVLLEAGEPAVGRVEGQESARGEYPTGLGQHAVRLAPGHVLDALAAVDEVEGPDG